MDRRSFFKLGKEALEDAVDKAEKLHITRQSSQWIRPPYAIDEVDFLDACTRCGDCITACPHDVIFPIPTKYGEEFSSTPILNLSEKGCHLCEDWPCVNVCKTSALSFPSIEDDKDHDLGTLDVNSPEANIDFNSPEVGLDSRSSGVDVNNLSETYSGDVPEVEVFESLQTDSETFSDEIVSEEVELPILAIAAVDESLCITYMGPECGACQSVCPVEGALNWQLNRPSINHEVCVGCGLCREACITEPKSVNIESVNRIA